MKSTTEPKSSLLGGTMNSIKSFIGLGILTLPSGFSNSGWIGGILLFLIIGFLSQYLSIQLMKMADENRSNARSVTEFCVECFGQKIEPLLNGFVILCQSSICVAYALFFTTYFQESLCFFVDHNQSYYICSSRLPSLLFSLILLAPTIFISDLSKLKDFCIVANTLILISLAVIVYSSISVINNNPLPQGSLATFNWAQMGQAIGLFIFTFEGQTIYFEIRHSMKEPKQFITALNIAYFISLFSYIVIGITGYTAFGNQSKDIILFNFPMTNIVFVGIQILYSIAILLSYPLQMFPIVNIFELKMIQEETPKVEQRNPQEASDNGEESDSLILQQDAGQNESRDEQSELTLNNSQFNGLKLKSSIFRIFCLTCVFIIALGFEKLSTFISFSGSICGCFFCFILPVTAIEKCTPNLSTSIKYIHRFLLIIGLILSSFGLYAGAVGLIKQY